MNIHRFARLMTRYDSEAKWTWNGDVMICHEMKIISFWSRWERRNWDSWKICLFWGGCQVVFGVSLLRLVDICSPRRRRRKKLSPTSLQWRSGECVVRTFSNSSVFFRQRHENLSLLLRRRSDDQTLNTFPSYLFSRLALFSSVEQFAVSTRHGHGISELADGHL